MNGRENVEIVSASAWYVRGIPHLLNPKKLQNIEAKTRSEKEPIALAQLADHPRRSALGIDRCANDVKTRTRAVIILSPRSPIGSNASR
jgi:hypothetical protein